jgi:hypothetical protein
MALAEKHISGLGVRIPTITPKLKLKDADKNESLSWILKFFFPGNCRTMMSTQMMDAPRTQAIPDRTVMIQPRSSLVSPMAAGLVFQGQLFLGIAESALARKPRTSDASRNAFASITVASLVMKGRCGCSRCLRSHQSRRVRGQATFILSFRSGVLIKSCC